MTTSPFWLATDDRSKYAEGVLSRRDQLTTEHHFDLACTLARRGFVEPFLDLQWGPLISETELIAGSAGLYLDDWQLDLVSCLNRPSYSRVSVAGNTGCGKNFASALALLVYYYAHKPSKLVITRDTYDAAVIKAWGEVDRWARLMKYRPHGKLTSGGLTTSIQHFVSVANPMSNEGFSGLHSETGSVAMWFDEATSIPQSRYDDASAQTDKLLITFNPRTMSGPTRDSFPSGRECNVTGTRLGPAGRERYISVSGDCAENFPSANIRLRRLSKPIGPIGGIEIDGRRFERGEHIPPDYYQQVRPLVPGQTCYDTWLALGDNERTRRVFCYGFFPEESSDLQVVLPSWFDRAAKLHTRWHQLMRCAKGMPLPGDQLWRTPKKVRSNLMRLLNERWPINAVGLDVAGSDDGDETILAIGGWKGCRELLGFKSSDLTIVVDWVETRLTERKIDKSVPIGCDMDGLGQGVGNMLARAGWNVVSLRGSDKPKTKRWRNSRCERVGAIGERLDPVGEFAGHEFALPPDEKLRQELLAYEKFGTGADQTILEVTPKRGDGVKIVSADTTRIIEPIVKQLKRSPDRADAVGYMLAVTRRSTLTGWLDSL